MAALVVILGVLTFGVGVAISVILIFSEGPYVAGIAILQTFGTVFAGASVILVGGSTYVLCSIDERLEKAGRELPPAVDANRPAAQSAAATGTEANLA